MRAIVSGLLAACVTGATALPATLSAQEEVEQLESECAAGKAQACVELGDRHTSDVPLTEEDWRRAASFYEQGCNLGRWNLCFSLALMYDLGFNRWVTKDTVRANELFKQGCLLDYERACELIRR